MVLSHFFEKCTGCGLCVDICEEFGRALRLDQNTETGETQIRIAEEKCINCGWCAINCPFGALEFLKENKPQQIKSQEVEAPIIRKRIEFREDLCVICGECEKICPQDAIKVRGVIKITATDGCTLCGLCRVQCPENAISIDYDVGEVKIDGSSCVRCGACEQICPTEKINMACLHCLESLKETSKLEEVCDFQFESSVSVDRGRCIYCGRCEAVCPAEAIEVRKPFEGSISVRNKDCEEGCVDCLVFCPTDSIKRVDGELVIDQDSCFYCGACYRICSSDAISFKRKTVGVIDNKGKLATFSIK